MIVLGTNVVSEAMKPTPDPAVRSWLNEQVAETLYLASVTLAELLFGIGALPDGRRKKALAEMLDGVLELFGDRVLPFDIGAARHYAGLAETARAARDSRRPTDISPPLPPPGDLSSRHAISARSKRRDLPW
jgi:toxin FitB